MSEKVNDFEYAFVVCRKCEDRVKIAKNKGNYWVMFNSNDEWLFMLHHSDCNVKGLVLEFTNE